MAGVEFGTSVGYCLVADGFNPSAHLYVDPSCYQFGTPSWQVKHSVLCLWVMSCTPAYLMLAKRRMANSYQWFGKGLLCLGPRFIGGLGGVVLRLG